VPLNEAAGKFSPNELFELSFGALLDSTFAVRALAACARNRSVTASTVKPA
jgi:hypothetical protein